MDTPGVEVLNHCGFRYDDAPHGHMEAKLDNVRVPAENMLFGEGRGFEIAKDALALVVFTTARTIGLAERFGNNVWSSASMPVSAKTFEHSSGRAHC